MAEERTDNVDTKTDSNVALKERAALKFANGQYNRLVAGLSAGVTPEHLASPGGQAVVKFFYFAFLDYACGVYKEHAALHAVVDSAVRASLSAGQTMLQRDAAIALLDQARVALETCVHLMSGFVDQTAGCPAYEKGIDKAAAVAKSGNSTPIREGCTEPPLH